MNVLAVSVCIHGNSVIMLYRLYVFKTPSGEGLQGAHSKCHQLFAKLFCNSSIVYEIVLTIV